MILDCNQVIIKLRKIIYSGLPQSIIPIQSSWRTLRTISHSLMVHVRVLEYYIHFMLIYTVDHIFLVLPIIYLISKDGKPTTPHKLVKGTKPSILYLSILFVSCVVWKATAYVETKVLNMRHQVQNGIFDISVGIIQHQKIYPVHVPHKQKIISSCVVVFDESFYIELAYTSLPYSDAMAMQPAVSYATYATYSVEQTGDIITFTQFEEGGLLS